MDIFQLHWPVNRPTVAHGSSVSERAEYVMTANNGSSWQGTFRHQYPPRMQLPDHGSAPLCDWSRDRSAQ